MYKAMTKNIMEDNEYIPITSSLYNCFIFSRRGWKQSTTSGNTVPPVDNSSQNQYLFCIQTMSIKFSFLSLFDGGHYCSPCI